LIGGIGIDPATNALCLEPHGTMPPLIPSLIDMGVKPELVLNGGRSNVSDYRLFFKNSTANIAAMVSIGKQFSATGWNIDFEPQVRTTSIEPFFYRLSKRTPFFAIAPFIGIHRGGLLALQSDCPLLR
jgi:hypothetical protein